MDLTPNPPHGNSFYGAHWVTTSHSIPPGHLCCTGPTWSLPPPPSNGHGPRAVGMARTAGHSAPSSRTTPTPVQNLPLGTLFQSIFFELLPTLECKEALLGFLARKCGVLPLTSPFFSSASAQSRKCPFLQRQPGGKTSPQGYSKKSRFPKTQTEPQHQKSTLGWW